MPMLRGSSAGGCAWVVCDNERTLLYVTTSERCCVAVIPRITQQAEQPSAEHCRLMYVMGLIEGIPDGDSGWVVGVVGALLEYVK